MSRATAVASALLVLGALLVSSGCVTADEGRRASERDRGTRGEVAGSKKPDVGASSDPSRPSLGVRRLARGPVSTGWRISRVVDGDTVGATRGARTLTLRLIGIDTPETVHPTEPIECFGPQATDFAARRLLGQRVALEFDRTQGRLDYYDRTLAYVWTLRGGAQQFNVVAVRRGFAQEYTYDDPYLWQPELMRAQASAVAQRIGVWRCPRPGS